MVGENQDSSRWGEPRFLQIWENIDVGHENTGAHSKHLLFITLQYLHHAAVYYFSVFIFQGADTSYVDCLFQGMVFGLEYYVLE